MIENAFENWVGKLSANLSRPKIAELKKSVAYAVTTVAMCMIQLIGGEVRLGSNGHLYIILSLQDVRDKAELLSYLYQSKYLFVSLAERFIAINNETCQSKHISLHTTISYFLIRICSAIYGNH